MANASSFMPLSKLDFSHFSSPQRTADKITPPPLNFKRTCSFPRKIHTFSGIKKSGLVLFSRLNDQIAAEKSPSSDELASFSNSGSELQVHTK
ncbi:hypothetical protein TIFTF001_050418 [Ficus carica]|uniref:Uncharacterized protein n=1 Tax=Ficus carica TaxID=3494 RepID=A0AA87ZFA4_FICCA|nr:hypothetical protein TIFTF001_050418 [Ficus carica]